MTTFEKTAKESYVEKRKNKKRKLKRREQKVVAFEKITKEERVKCCRLQGDSQGGERKGFALRRHKESVCECKEK